MAKECPNWCKNSIWAGEAATRPNKGSTKVTIGRTVQSKTQSAEAKLEASNNLPRQPGNPDAGCWGATAEGKLVVVLLTRLSPWNWGGLWEEG